MLLNQGGEMATAKIQMVNGLRVGDFFAPFAKKYYSSLDGLDSRNGVEWGLFFVIGYGKISSSINR